MYFTKARTQQLSPGLTLPEQFQLRREVLQRSAQQIDVLKRRIAHAGSARKASEKASVERDNLAKWIERQRQT